MKIATYNVNSLRAREERVLAWLAKESPDVVCLQELKLEDEKVPTLALAGLGYQVESFGQKTYNGVAILSKLPMTDVERGFGDGVSDPQARFIAATVGDLRVMCAYMPNGESVTSDKYQYKLAWFERLHAYLASRVGPGKTLLLGAHAGLRPVQHTTHKECNEV